MTRTGAIRSKSSKKSLTKRFVGWNRKQSAAHDAELVDTISSIPWTPQPYHKRGVKFLLQNACGILLLDPGLGKTSITLATIKLLIQQGLMKSALVVAPRRACHQVWTGSEGETQKWSDFTDLRVGLLRGSQHRLDVLNSKKPYDIYVINHEGLDWLFYGPGHPWRKIKDHVDTLVLDELSKYKHWSTERYKVLKPKLSHFARRWGLTGSPAAGGLLNLFSEAYVIDLGRTFGPYFTEYRRKYFLPVSDYKWVIESARAEKEIHKKLKPLAIRMAAEDYQKLPEFIPNTIMIELPDDVRARYDELEEEFFTIIEEQSISAVNSGVMMGKLRQITNGGIYVHKETVAGIKRRTIQLHDAKAEALGELLEELQGKPALIAYEYEQDLERIQKLLGKDVPYIGGGTSDREVGVIQRAWNRGEIPYLCGQPSSMAYALNFQFACQNVVWYALTWDYELYDQFNRRVRRSGNRFKRVFVHHLIGRNTIDEYMLLVLKQKRTTEQALLKALNTYRRRRTG